MAGHRRGFASPVAAELTRQADVVAAFGASFNMRTTRHGKRIGPGATGIQVDLAVVGDIRETALDRLEGPGRREVSGPGWRTPAVAAAIRAGAWRNAPYRSTPKP